VRQTSPLYLAAIPAPRGDARARDLTRLLDTWKSVAARLITAEAHALDCCDETYDQLTSIEEALQDRHPGMWVALESTLLTSLLPWQHDGAAIGAGDCLVCRRLATSGPPLDTPAPAVRSTL
jgi:hypothetical protein